MSEYREESKNNCHRGKRSSYQRFNLENKIKNKNSSFTSLQLLRVSHI